MLRAFGVASPQSRFGVRVTSTSWHLHSSCSRTRGSSATPRAESYLRKKFSRDCRYCGFSNVLSV
jgi:hypothetical protein